VRFLADECCPRLIVEWLRKAGHDVRYAVESNSGADDRSILSIAFDEDRLVITEDFDFGELTVRGQAPTRGVIIIAMGEESIEARVERIAELVSRHTEDLPGYLTIIDARRIRRRPLGLS
jgi:predicted nuclease of predicted toxin-antitoxin system